jgi:serine/threonine-protein kinase BUR1
MLTTTTREIKNLKLLDHENIVPLLEMVVQRKSGTFRREPPFAVICRRGLISVHGLPGDTEADIFLVFPYMEHDLCGYIHSTESTLTVDTLRIFAAQLLDGLKEMHRVSGQSGI